MDGGLGRLYFGRDDAEMDIAEGGLLHAGFLRTAAYDAVRNSRKHLIIGRKGSGKSAICRTLVTDTDPSLVTALVTPDELSADEIRRFELQGIPPEMAKGLMWRYILTIQVAKHLVAHAKAHGKHRQASVEALHRFLVANGELDETKPKFWQIIQKLKTSLSLEAFGVKATLELGGGPSEGIRTSDMLDVVDRNVSRAIADLACPRDHPRLLILIDQLEDVWSNDVDSDKLVIGLLRATREVSARFSRVSCVTFLRSDIYDLLRFPDKDKYRGDEMRVDWSSERLLELVLTRAQASLGERISSDHLWREIFPRSIDRTRSSEFVVSHTLMRPRDIIHLCNVCRDVAEQNGHAVIGESDVREAIAQYSSWKLQDLSNEYIVNYPFLGGLLAVFRNSSYLFARGAFEERFATSMGALRARFPEQAHMLTPDAVLRVLFDIGFLGVRRDDGVVYRRRNEDRIEPEDETFSIHPCFRYALHAELPIQALPSVSERTFNEFVVAQGNTQDFADFGRLSRGLVENRLLHSVVGYSREMVMGLLDSGLPDEITKDLSARLSRILRMTEGMSARPDLNMADVVQHATEVAAFLDQMSSNLERSGFAGAEKARYFIRRASDASRRLRREAVGIEES
jgi:hypothetical protein